MRLTAKLITIAIACGCRGIIEPVPAGSAVVDATGIALVVGETEQLTAYRVDSDGNPEGAAQNISWSSDATSIATISSTGLVTGMSPGRTLIRANLSGDEDTVTVNVETNAFAPLRATVLAVGGGHSCAITELSTAYCWGTNASGEWATGSASLMKGQLSPRRIALSESVANLSSGANHVCSLVATGRIQCWGDNLFGQLGYSGDHGLAPKQISTDSLFSTVTAGASLTCGLTLTSVPMCWGQLGARSLSSPSIVSVTSVRALTAGGMHVCAIRLDRLVECWGRNDYGQLGDGSTIERQTPTRILDNEEYQTISAGALHTCGLTVTSKVKCWGNNFSGRLGIGNEISTSVPTVVGLPDAATSVSAGGSHSCAVLTGGRAFCWGDNSRGQLGNALDFANPQLPSSAYRSAVPVEVVGSRFRSINAGAAEHTCAIATDGSTFCWGANNSGQLGVGRRERRTSDSPAVRSSPTIVRVPGM